MNTRLLVVQAHTNQPGSSGAASSAGTTSLCGVTAVCFDIGGTLIVERTRPAQLYPEVRAALAVLSGLTLAVISNCSSRDRDAFAALDIAAAFDVCVFSCDVGHAKPHPGPFRRAQQLLGLPAEQIAHVGDHPSGDIQAASRLGWQTVHLRRIGGLPRCPEATASITNLSELRGLLDPSAVKARRVSEISAPGP